MTTLSRFTWRIHSLVLVCCVWLACGGQGLEQFLSSSQGAELVASWVRTDLTSTGAGWQPAGVSLEAGQELTLFASGEIDVGLSQPLHPRHAIWYRIGSEGPAFNLASDFFTTRAENAGELLLAVRPLGVYWTDRRGTFPPEFLELPPSPIQQSVVTVVWRASATEGLEALSKVGVAEAEEASAAIRERRPLPKGFDYLGFLNQSNVFGAWAESGRKGIHASATDDLGIVKVAVDLPVTDGTAIEFDWRYLSLPALGPETEASFHDYLSIAVEFDNGHDITWFWSNSLEAEHSFRCPLEWWDQRETHIVLQSGSAGLGQWFSHRRPVKLDYLNAVGGKHQVASLASGSLPTACSAGSPERPSSPMLSCTMGTQSCGSSDNPRNLLTPLGTNFISTSLLSPFSHLRGLAAALTAASCSLSRRQWTRTPTTPHRPSASASSSAIGLT